MTMKRTDRQPREQEVGDDVQHVPDVRHHVLVYRSSDPAI